MTLYYLSSRNVLLSAKKNNKDVDVASQATSMSSSSSSQLGLKIWRSDLLRSQNISGHRRRITIDDGLLSD
jgi:hypothetical protein